MSEELDKIIEELQDDADLSTMNQEVSAEKLDITDENVNNYVMQKVGGLVETGIETIEAIQQSIHSGFNAEELSAFSGLIASVTKAAETLNKINIQNKKAKNSKELKEMEITAKAELPSGGNTNILIATRDEIIEQFLDKNKNVLEAEIEEENIEDDKS